MQLLSYKETGCPFCVSSLILQGPPAGWAVQLTVTLRQNGSRAGEGRGDVCTDQMGGHITCGTLVRLWDK